MHYEHREKRLNAALDYAEKALHKAWQRQALKRSYGIGSSRTGRTASKEKDTKQLEEIAQLEKRVNRLQQKSESLSRSRAGASKLQPRRKRGNHTPGLKDNSEEKPAFIMDSLI
jgi:hypothetical protein